MESGQCRPVINDCAKGIEAERYMRRVWKEPPKYEEAPLKNLNLEALLRIDKKLAEMESKLKDYEIAKPAYDARVAAYVAPLEDEIRQMHEKAEPLHNRRKFLWQIINAQLIGHVHRYDTMLSLLIGAGKALLTPNDKSLIYEGRKFRECVKSEIDEHSNLSGKIGAIAHQEGLIRARILKPEVGPAPRPPARSFQIHDHLKTFTVDVDRMDRTLLMSMLEEKKKMKLEQQEVHQEVKAKARAYDDKQREYAKSVRNKIKHQLREYPNCPYCGRPLDISPQAHADHIYPLALGGLSTAKNMVFVCEDCNQKKKTRTLREFIKEFGLDEHFVNRNLEQLRKKF